MKTKHILTVALLLSVSALSADAQIRQHRPYNRSGLNIGISRTEAFRLGQMKAELRRDMIRAKRNDGRIGPLERRYLKQEHKQLRRSEWRMRHNCPG